MPSTTTRTKRDSHRKIEKGGRDSFLDMASLMVHDLEGPLASMKTVLRLLERGHYDPQKELHQKLVLSTRIAIERSEAIIEDLMTVAKMESLSLPVDIESFDLIPVLGESILMASSFASENNIEIVMGHAPISCSVTGDKNLVARVADNLVFNAVRHTPSGGIITIDIDIDNLIATVSVTDSGSGFGDIDPDELFTKYRQAKLRKERKHHGVGLGLYFCRLATEAMNGSVWAGTAPSGGAVFSFTIPAGGNDDGA